LSLLLLYTSITGDVPPPGDLTRELAAETPRRQRAVMLRALHTTWHDIGLDLGLTRQAAQRLVDRTMRAIYKRLLQLPRYDRIGHPPPMRRSAS
jgi:hypothetical protein